MDILGNLYVEVQVMKRKLSILLLAASLLAFSDLPVLAEESQVSDLQETTVESSQVQEAGQAEKPLTTMSAKRILMLQPFLMGKW